MDIEFIEIQNFKGIKNLKINFNKHTKNRFYTLVGLNESGKTTILEAINNFCYGPERLEGLELDEVGEVPPDSVIPIAQRSNFNGSTVITLSVAFSAIDISSLKRYLFKEHPSLKISDISNSAEVSYTLEFNNSKLASSSRLWDFHIKGREGKQRKITKYGAKSPVWQNAVKFLSQRFPDIIYFPNFLFDFPSRIYLDSEGNLADAFYRKLLQDILDALGSGCDLKTHILERMKNASGENHRNLRAVLLEMERELTKTVFASWDSIFGKSTSGKKIHIIPGNDPVYSPLEPKKGKHFLEFQLEDANGQCQISERSLGFRWFFVFRLLTYYRGHRNSRKGDKKVLFLLDEPASNLHPTAQSKLLRCLEELPSECQLIYTTHSHHLINPKWLETAYVVKNEGLEYQGLTDFNYSAKQTNITATLYRDFVGQHPEQTYYFKPILDVLDYAPSQLEFNSGGVLVEGKNDYYVLNYLNKCLKLSDLNFNLIPGGGCETLNPLIQLYSGWGKEFCILLDSDKAGEKSKQKYSEEWGSIVHDRLFSLADVKDELSGKALEAMFTQNDQDLIYDKVGQPANKNKKAFNRALQELWVRKEFVTFEVETQERFQKVFQFLRDFFERISNSSVKQMS
jgi:predicted ATP-dependent endonuclease of OLD family